MKAKFKLVAHGSQDWEVAVQLREEILRKPLEAFFTDEELDEEKDHVQVIGVMDNEIIATAVLVPENDHLKMQRVVVSHQLRSLKIGTEMMQFCEGYAKNHQYKWVYCHARNSAVAFYLQNGYQGEGDYFDEDGIPHLKMGKKIIK